MPDNRGDPHVGKPSIDELLAAYLEAVDSGNAPDRAEFIAAHPELKEELASFFTDCNQLDFLVQPLQAAAGIHRDANVATLPPNSRFGDYELLEEIARGGMGVVYKARQISLGRIVALKMILAGSLASRDAVRRFRSEAEAAASLDHANIVPIHEVGEHEGTHFFSMRYVEGHSLAARLSSGPLPSRMAASLLIQVCDAVQYAHEHGVVHRDLKPANILLQQPPDAGPEYAVPLVTDFGLAKRLKADPALTLSGQIMGTPSYMSPEQATAGSHAVGPTSDVYALGAILYHSLAGRPPFQAESPLETLNQLCDSDPLPPRLLNRNVPRDLEAICLKCLEKDAVNRYATARELADDLRRFVAGETIQASGINLLDQVTRALRHSRHEDEFQEWGWGLMAFGAVIFVAHVAIFALENDRFSVASVHPWTAYFLTRGAMFAALLIMLWRFRRHSILPMNAPERLIWVVWIGYLLALTAINGTRVVFGHDHTEIYAVSAGVAGLCFLIMGSHVWGGGYAIGGLFMIAAPLLAYFQQAAPLLSGTLWAGGLAAFGLHCLYRGQTAGRSGEQRR